MKIVNWALSVFSVMVLIMAIFTVGPMLETKFFPVYSKFTILDAQPTEEGVMMRLQFTKWRNCDPQGYAWYVGDFGKGVRQLAVRSTPSPVTRPLGTQTTQPVLIKDLKVEELPLIFAEIYNRCHPFWTTRSEIYP